MEYYNYIKALHLIFVITWFAGLFYIPRLFIYQIETYKKAPIEKEVIGKQLQVMTKRLWYIITWPSAILASIFAVALLVLQPAWLQQGWMHVKLTFVLLLFIYHGKCHLLFLASQKGQLKWSSNKMRIFNEGATLILFSVVFLVILKSSINWIFGVIGIFVLAIMLMLGIKLYKRIRERKQLNK